MRRGRQYIGLPISDYRSKELLAIISDLVFDPTGRIVGFLIAPKKGVFRKERIISIDAFLSVTPEGALVDGHEALENELPKDAGWYLLAKNKGLCGKRIVTEDGGIVGMVGDVIVAEERGTVKGFEVSDGIVMDFLDGREVISAEGATIGEDDIVIT